MDKRGHMIEIYHFINPLGKLCYDTEKIIKEFSEESYDKISVRFIPFLNLRILSLQLERENLMDISFDERNQLYTNAYQSSLGFYAASMQGKKRGRQFLMALQELIITNEQDVSLDTFKEVASQIKIDIEMFEEDYHSNCARKMFEADQKLAQKMNVSETPSVLIYSSRDNDACYLIENAINKSMLHDLCQADYEENNADVIQLNSNLLNQ